MNRIYSSIVHVMAVRFVRNLVLDGSTKSFSHSKGCYGRRLCGLAIFILGGLFPTLNCHLSCCLYVFNLINCSNVDNSEVDMSKRFICFVLRCDFGLKQHRFAALLHL